MASIDYRPEVDGLRAVAVLAVILFHFGVSGVSGGFIGVDVFFVISGYLITGIVWRELQNGTFSFSRFYERRVRRLFPALFFVCVVTFALSATILVEGHRQDAVGSIIFALTSLSNVYFWSQSGYFDAEALYKPVLHTWSLSVEEQFYMVWPAMLLFVFHYRQHVLTWWLVAAAAIGFLALSEYGTKSLDPTAAFYLTPFRVFEFACGAILVALPSMKRLPVVEELLCVLGLAILAFTIVTYTDATPFPGLSALLPCIGSALAIYAGASRISGTILSNPLSVAIGKISYSLYLVHWPIAVFFDSYTFRSPTVVDQIMMLVASIALAAFMYRFIETPFRRTARSTRRLSAPAFGLACAGLTLALVVPSAYYWNSDRSLRDEFAQLPSIAGEKIIEALNLVGAIIVPTASAQGLLTESVADIRDGRVVFTAAIGCTVDVIMCGFESPGQTNVLIIGDSTSVDSYNALLTAFPEHNFLLMQARSCPPFEISRDDEEFNAACPARNAERIPMIEALSRVKHVVVHVRMIDQRAPAYAGFIDYLSSLGKKVIVIGGGFFYERPAPEVYQRLATASDPRPDLAEFRPHPNFVIDEDVAAAVEAVGGVFIDRKPLLCPNGVCSDYTNDNQHLRVADKIHMSMEAGMELGQYIRTTYPTLFDAP